ncbi:Ctr copper transporter family-domain-containing protein [Lasiosphaeris hirsuta]|uniref:Copper transport protein n=1 Tax=Lasiosphaeris hirsuta TaxID=260670 RepID=A0AA40A9S9_9PEZI|nr:Ctr copper transporter family-domain-containing protein [Lasiosphaeris hirsuta]
MLCRLAHPIPRKGTSLTLDQQMLWNWYTVDSCFISSTWQIRSAGMMAGSCIAVILLVMLLEVLRRGVKEYDRFLLRKHAASHVNLGNIIPKAGSSNTESTAHGVCLPQAEYRPTIIEQAVRALLHTCQFAVAYFVMLLAMYYNGYIIICIFIGAYLGSFVFQWETLGLGPHTSATNEGTVCCG